ncbi:hypothetical protein DXG01_007314 [Tephrocybe rancida]|nr:hypothetical protein DXG01_007314 [Tephrocybe rancida]
MVPASRDIAKKPKRVDDNHQARFTYLTYVPSVFAAGDASIPLTPHDMKSSAVLTALSALAVVYACGDGHDHTVARRSAASSQSSVTPPSRPLEWGDINIIHTTDSHGWLLGHQKASFPEPNYSGDFGDFASFVAHMKEIALKKDVDLLLVDSGDLHDGKTEDDSENFPRPHDWMDTQLEVLTVTTFVVLLFYSETTYSSRTTFQANKFFSQLPYDLLAIGNHELYIYNNTLDMHLNFVPKFKGRYLSSNVNITLPDKHGNYVSVPVGDRYAKFKTRKGRQVTSLGVLYDFTGAAKNTTVQKVEDMVKERWFAEAIQEEPDLFLLAGHMPVAKDNWPLVFNAIRAVHPYTPIIILGGHTHIRDCVQFDGRSMALESGRYMETLAAKLDKTSHSHGNGKDKSKPSKPKDIVFSRRYLDPNRVTYEYHTGHKNSQFDTSAGTSITKGLQALSKAFNLDFLFGTAPHDFTVTQAPYPSEDSSLSLFAEDALPIALAVNNTRSSIPNLIITNSGSQRFDIYAGTFTKNDQLTASPFADAFLYIPGIKLSLANDVLASLNGAGSDNRRSLIEERETVEYGLGYVDKRYRGWLQDMDRRHGVERRSAKNQTLGYVTTDIPEQSCPGVGDDTLHAPLPFFDVPDFVASKPPAVGDDDLIDLVFVDFIETQLLKILNTAQSDKTYTTADVSVYTPVLASEALGIYAQAAWN